MSLDKKRFILLSECAAKAEALKSLFEGEKDSPAIEIEKPQQILIEQPIGRNMTQKAAKWRFPVRMHKGGKVPSVQRNAVFISIENGIDISGISGQRNGMQGVVDFVIVYLFDVATQASFVARGGNAPLPPNEARQWITSALSGQERKTFGEFFAEKSGGKVAKDDWQTNGRAGQIKEVLEKVVKSYKEFLVARDRLKKAALAAAGDDMPDAAAIFRRLPETGQLALVVDRMTKNGFLDDVEYVVAVDERSRGLCMFIGQRARLRYVEMTETSAKKPCERFQLPKDVYKDSKTKKPKIVLIQNQLLTTEALFAALNAHKECGAVVVASIVFSVAKDKVDQFSKKLLAASGPVAVICPQ